MKESILTFAEEFAWQPQIANEARLEHKGKVIVAGMGGSPLAADLLNALDPKLNITVHKDYGLPLRKDPLVIAISYSGNTEETIDAFDTAQKNGLPVAAIATGGKLLERAQEAAAPFIRLPQTNIQPRMATGFIIKALAALMGLEQLKNELSALAQTLKPTELEGPGKTLAEKLGGRVLLVYASTRNRAIAYNWKIKFNETGKIPAFYNVFPELNHNEMNAPSPQCYTIILRDPDDDPRIQKRMEALKNLYQQPQAPAEIIDTQGENRLVRIFNSLLLADWTALAIAEERGVDPEQVPLVEEFKKHIA